VRELELALEEAKSALLRSAAQDVLVEQIVAKLGSLEERRSRHGPAAAPPPSGRKRKATA